MVENPFQAIAAPKGSWRGAPLQKIAYRSGRAHGRLPALSRKRARGTALTAISG